MRLRLSAAATAAALAFFAGPALAGDHRYEPGPPPLDPRGAPYPGGPVHGSYGGFDEGAREAWLADCRKRLSSRDSGLGGAVIGGVVGGIAGNRIAGRGNRTVGTVAGAAIGAAAGAAIDKAEDAGRNRDECEAYLDDYYARYTQGGYPGYGYQQGYYPAYGYQAQGCCMMAMPVMMAPVMMVPVTRAEPECTETVEYVYEDVPVRPRKRHVPRRTKIVPDKRVPLK